MGARIIEYFTSLWNHLIDMIPNLILAILVFSFFSLIGFSFYKIMKKRIIRRSKETIVSNFIIGLIKWIFYLIAFISALNILQLGPIATSFLTGAGITAIIFGFAFKDIGENFLAGFLLAVNRPFRIGNIIEVNGHKGVVKGMELRNTHIRNIEGKDIYIPNAMIVKNVVVNYTKDGLLRQQFEIGVDIPCNFDKAKKLILEYLSDQSEVLKKPEPNVIVTRLDTSTLVLEVLFYVDILKQKTASPSYLGITIRSKMISSIKDLLLNNGYHLPATILEHTNYSGPVDVSINSTT